MTKTAEEIYNERLQEAARYLVVEYLDNSLDYLSVVESLEEIGEDDPDFQKDAYELANEQLSDLFDYYVDEN